MAETDQRSPNIEHRLQVIDVYIVDVLAHIEALLRHTHSLQRVLLRLRSEAPPPRPAVPPHVHPALRGHTGELERECGLLQQIIQDLVLDIDMLGGSKQQRTT